MADELNKNRVTPTGRGWRRRRGPGLVPAEALLWEADGRQYQAGIRAMGTVEGDKAPLPIGGAAEQIGANVSRSKIGVLGYEGQG
ncbi:Hypothetical predicted protein [Podarcis lilfordi]|uniref:Uncharacterized protein n=1 Tax=Podarcis lilfordi TaxID=74358 RepID=A0AA35KQ12_9SAUR|nr:Hypothetical predicted protein [Podarcis lilfordi]